MEEKWKEYEYRGIIYKVSNYGRIIGARGKILKTRLDEDGYLSVTLGGEHKGRSGVRVHRIVALLFVENSNPNKYVEVNHKDFNRENCRADNLEWTTHSNNINYSMNKGRLKGKTQGSFNGRATFTEEDIIQIRLLYKEGNKISEIAKQFNSKWSTINNIVKRLTWKHI